MLAAVGCESIEQLLAEAVPAGIRDANAPDLGAALSEEEALDRLRELAACNAQAKAMIGQGYSGTFMPQPIQRLLLESPSWYTAYTPYQPEISQGRLEMLLNFQTLCAELAGLPHAGASLLDEATAAAEAMVLLRRAHADADASRLLVDDDLLVQTLAVLATRAEPLGIEIVRCSSDSDFDPQGAFGALLGMPDASGAVRDRSELIGRLADAGVRTAACADPLALCMVKPPGEQGAAVAVGSMQRFGLPMGCGGPHAGYMAFADGLQRLVPGRLVGIARDAQGRPALRLALQTREQHIRRAKATSNICTAQALPAMIAAAYAVYHGPTGLQDIAQRTHAHACALADACAAAGFELVSESFFDTVRIRTDQAAQLHARAAEAGFDLHLASGSELGIACDETTTAQDVAALAAALGASAPSGSARTRIPEQLQRAPGWLRQPVFAKYRSEHAFVRYLRRLADRDIALDRSMIPLGSCTMKLNAASELAALSWPEFGSVHPQAPADRRAGYAQIADELSSMLCAVTGMDGASLQPNAGAQGEYAGLLAIRSYHRARSEAGRDVCLIPESAHGTNAASAAMAGLETVAVRIDADGEVDMEHLAELCAQHSDRLAALMITYPSTCGIYGAEIAAICEQVHAHGGQVYMDGANLNALVGVARPGKFGADVIHINLHKTFCIPHGGGGPGMGPIACRKHLIAHLPGDPAAGAKGAVSAAALGSALLLPISWAYMRMMGGSGLRLATGHAVLAANYMAQRLGASYRIAYRGAAGRVAHEFIIDAREFKRSAGISAEDIAKRLIDFGFHAPTVSFPLAGAVMIEPTESEPQAELDRFCEAMERIRAEIADLESGQADRASNLLSCAPHPAEDLLDRSFDRSYAAEDAAYPLPWVRERKYFPPVARIDQAFGDRNLATVLEPDAEFLIGKGQPPAGG